MSVSCASQYTEDRIVCNRISTENPKICRNRDNSREISGILAERIFQNCWQNATNDGTEKLFRLRNSPEFLSRDDVKSRKSNQLDSSIGPNANLIFRRSVPPANYDTAIGLTSDRRWLGNVIHLSPVAGSAIDGLRSDIHDIAARRYCRENRFRLPLFRRDRLARECHRPLIRLFSASCSS